MPSILQFHHRRVLETPKSHFPKYFEPPDSINGQFKDRDKYDKTQSYTLPHQTSDQAWLYYWNNVTPTVSDAEACSPSTQLPRTYKKHCKEVTGMDYKILFL